MSDAENSEGCGGVGSKRKRNHISSSKAGGKLLFPRCKAVLHMPSLESLNIPPPPLDGEPDPFAVLRGWSDRSSRESKTWQQDMTKAIHALKHLDQLSFAENQQHEHEIQKLGEELCKYYELYNTVVSEKGEIEQKLAENLKRNEQLKADVIVKATKVYRQGVEDYRSVALSAYKQLHPDADVKLFETTLRKAEGDFYKINTKETKVARETHHVPSCASCNRRV